MGLWPTFYLRKIPDFTGVFSSILAGNEASAGRFTRPEFKGTMAVKLEEIRKAESPNLLTTYRDRLALYSAARREFGSWKQALESAGYKLTKGSHKNSNQIFKADEVPAGKVKPQGAGSTASVAPSV